MDSGQVIVPAPVIWTVTPAVMVVSFSDMAGAMKILEANGTKMLVAADLGIENE